MKTLSSILAVLGFFLFIGAAGSFDLGTMSFFQALIQVLIGFLLFVGGIHYGLYMHKR